MAAAVGCTVEASYRASGSLVVREQRLWQGATLLAESYMTFLVR